MAASTDSAPSCHKEIPPCPPPERECQDDATVIPILAAAPSTATSSPSPEQLPAETYPARRQGPDPRAAMEPKANARLPFDPRELIGAWSRTALS